MDDIRASLERVRERVARAAERAGRRAEEVLLIGVSKTVALARIRDRKSTRLNSSHDQISYAVFCLKKKKTTADMTHHALVVARPPPLGHRTRAADRKVGQPAAQPQGPAHRQPAATSRIRTLASHPR